MQTSPEHQLFQRLLSPEIMDDPYNFVMFAFPWGQPNTPLEHHGGPRSWQVDVLTQIRDHIHKQRTAQMLASPLEVFRLATASGRGIGKSALVSWLSLWMMSTRLGSTVIISANSEPQLKTVTWGELGKWLAMSINKHWFDLSATMVKPSDHLTKIMSQVKRSPQYNYIQGKLWTEENPDAYAGAHNPLGMMVIFDEGSGIPAPIWNVAEGYFTEPIVDRYWLAFSNPRRNTGAFFECFHKNRDFWRTRHIDSRTVEGTDIQVYEKIIAQYGEDSDVARVEVKGEFPRQGDRQFISREAIDNAAKREVQLDPHAPLIMGVDPARYGDDSSVIRFRRGRDAKTIAPRKFKGLDNMQLAYECADLIGKYNPDAVCIDAGNGTGIIDRLRDLGYVVHEVWFGAKSSDSSFANKRTELWGKMRDWLGGATIDADQALMDDLAGPEYKFAKNGDAIILESKEEMKSRGLHSPDDADALACTFAVNVSRSDTKASRRNEARRGATARDVDYSLFGE